MAKCEARGKYAGCKWHADANECQDILDWHVAYKARLVGHQVPTEVPIKYLKQIAKAIRELLQEHPDMLKERTEAEVKASLEKDQKKITEQLSTIQAKKDWKAVK